MMLACCPPYPPPTPLPRPLRSCRARGRGMTKGGGRRKLQLLKKFFFFFSFPSSVALIQFLWIFDKKRFSNYSLTVRT